MAKSLKSSLFVVLLIITFIDFFRKLLGGEPLLLAIVDASLLFLLFFFYAPYLFGWRKRLGVLKGMGPFLKLALGLYIFIVIIQALNPSMPSWLVALAGLRSYLLAIPMIGVGWYVAETWRDKDYEQALKVIRFLIVLSVLFGALDLMTRPLELPASLANVLRPLEGGHMIHSFGFTTIELTSSFFASSKRWARCLLFLYLFAWAYLAVSKRHTPLYLSFVVFLGLFLSGSREGLVMFVVFHMLKYAFREPRKGLMYATILSILSISILISYPSSYPEAEEKGILLRLRFFLSTSEDWLFRAAYMFRAPVKLVLTGGEGINLLTGNGLGSYGQETRLLGVRPEPPGWIPAWARDAGLIKIIVELGIVGLVIFIMLQVAILSYVRLKKARCDPLFLAAFSSVVIWLVFFLKGHPIMSDQMTNIFYWFNVGILIQRGALTRQSHSQALALKKIGSRAC
ncbi:hypothetical protein ACVNPS_03970 [Candidatus Bipolaricaulota sp. J31]